MSRSKPPTNVGKLAVPREAYLPLLKSLAKLKQRELEKIKGKAKGRQPVPIFCADCGEYVRDHTHFVDHVRCLVCNEKRRELAAAVDRANMKRLNKKRYEELKETDRTCRHACKSRSELDLELMSKLPDDPLPPELIELADTSQIGSVRNCQCGCGVSWTVTEANKIKRNATIKCRERMKRRKKNEGAGSV